MDETTITEKRCIYLIELIRNLYECNGDHLLIRHLSETLRITCKSSVPTLAGIFSPQRLCAHCSMPFILGRYRLQMPPHTSHVQLVCEACTRTTTPGDCRSAATDTQRVRQLQSKLLHEIREQTRSGSPVDPAHKRRQSALDTVSISSSQKKRKRRRAGKFAGLNPVWCLGRSNAVTGSIAGAPSQSHTARDSTSGALSPPPDHTDHHQATAVQSASARAPVAITTDVIESSLNDHRVSVDDLAAAGQSTVAEIAATSPTRLPSASTCGQASQLARQSVTAITGCHDNEIVSTVTPPGAQTLKCERASKRLQLFSGAQSELNTFQQEIAAAAETSQRRTHRSSRVRLSRDRRRDRSRGGCHKAEIRSSLLRFLSSVTTTE